MKGKMTILVLAFVLAASFASAQDQSAKAAPGATTGTPQYGGTLTVAPLKVNQEPTSWNQADGDWAIPTYSAPYGEHLLAGDVEKYGPRGTNEMSFMLRMGLSGQDKYLKGELAESWELSANPIAVIFHLRHGIMFAANPNIGFKPREFTAYDAAYCLNAVRKSFRGQTEMLFMSLGGAEALDKYTVRVKFDYYDYDWPLKIGWGYFSKMYGPEVDKSAAPADWKNQIGTGPFIITDYVKGSYASYKKNPDWWDKQKTINGKKYDTPFIDKLVMPIIVDESTLIAAVRTGKIDWATYIKLNYQQTLAKTCPDLVMKEVPAAEGLAVRFNCSTGALANKAVRQALTMGADKEALIKAVYLKGNQNSNPYNAGLPTTVYTPIKDLPTVDQALFTYNPEKAKQMLADAGYPHGFDLQIDYGTDRVAAGQTAAILQDMWSKLGINVKLQPHDQADLYNLEDHGKYAVAIRSENNTSPSVNISFRFGQSWRPFGTDTEFQTMAKQALGEKNGEKRNALLKQLGIKVIDYADSIGVYPNLLTCYWPWVKNYYGEVDSGHDNIAGMLPTLWLDQPLKKKMGF